MPHNELLLLLLLLTPKCKEISQGKKITECQEKIKTH